MTTTKTKGQLVAADISALLRARNPLIYLITREEARAEALLIEAASAAGYAVKTWDCAAGICEIGGKAVDGLGDTQDPAAVLAVVKDAAEGNNTRIEGRTAWILRDMPYWLSGPVGPTTQRALRNLARLLPSIKRDNAQALIILTPVSEIPPELAGHATVVELPLPDRTEIASILDAALGSLPTDMQATAAPNGARDSAVDAAVGLSGEEAAACYARSLVQLRRIDAPTVAKEKRRVIARERVLEWYDPIPGGLDAVGGLDLLKGWLVARKSAYSPKARAYGLPAPKGCLLVGVPGCGKSLTAKAIATAWGVPLIRLDVGSLKSKFVGESEGNLRKAIKVIEAVGRCVVWLDEIEKALQGATSGSADGGVSSDALGTILSWMQERQGEAFVIATANDVTALPPELLRKGRFDELWFVDLPTQIERAAILGTALKIHGRNGKDLDAAAIVAATEGFTGSEIAALVPDALFVSFNDGERELTTADLIAAAKTVVPLAKTAAEKIATLRSWAKGRARMATSVEATTPDELAARKAPAGRTIDL
jgi:hypothetical protein